MRRILLLCGLLAMPVLATTIQPDKPRTIQLSAKDVNRITCANGLVQDAFYSEEKVNQVSIEGNMVFIKLPIKKKGEILTYATNVVDFDIICDGLAYKFFAEPKSDLRGQIVYLGDPELSQALDNLQLLDGMDAEDQFVMMIDAVMSHGRLNNHLFNAMTKEITDEVISLAGRNLTLQNSYRFSGAGLRIKHYQYPVEAGESYREEQFLLPQISSGARAITVHPLTIAADGWMNVIVIEDVH